MKKTIILFLTLLLSIQSFSQRNKKWIKPTEEEIKSKYYEEDSSAHAAVLREECNVYFDDWQGQMRLFYEVRRKVKIYDNEGMKDVNLEFYYTGKFKFEEFGNIKAVVYNYDNGHIVKTKLRSKDIVVQNINDTLYKLTITFPEVKPGSVIDYYYLFTTNKFATPPKWFFQKDIPTKYSEFNANIPNFMTYYFDIVGQEYLTESQVDDDMVNWNIDFRYENPAVYAGYRIKGEYNFRFPGKYYHFVMEDVPAFYSEPFLDNPDNYKFSVAMYLFRLTKDLGYFSDLSLSVFELSTKRMYSTLSPNYNIEAPQYSHSLIYPAGYIIVDGSRWDWFVKNYRKDSDFGKALARFVDVNSVVDSIKKKSNGSYDLIANIYDYVQKNIKWNGLYTQFVDRKLQKVYNAKQGSSADINFLLIYMLRKAGFDAYPVVLRTVDQGKTITSVAAYYMFNHTVAAVNLNDKTIILDAAKKENTPWYVLPKNDLNGAGRLIMRDSSYWVPLQHAVLPRKNWSANFTIDSTTLKGTVTLTEKGAFVYYNDFDLLGNELSFARLTGEGQVKHGKQLYFSLNADNAVQYTDTMMFIRPFYMFASMKNPFTQYNRFYPLYLENPWRVVYKVTYQIPEGYDIAQQMVFNKAISGASLTLSTDVNGRNVTYTLVLDIKQYIFAPSQYQDLKNLFEQFYKIRFVKIGFPVKK